MFNSAEHDAVFAQFLRKCSRIDTGNGGDARLLKPLCERFLRRMVRVILAVFRNDEPGYLYLVRFEKFLIGHAVIADEG